MKILMSTAEMFPFAKTGGLADVTGALPAALAELGQEVVITLPRYKGIKAGKLRKLNKSVSYLKTNKNVTVYFIENSKFFARDGLYGDTRGDYEDNLKRFTFYCKETLKLLKEINFKPDIVHCHDWQAALIPVYLKTVYKNDPFYAQTKTILTIHNIGYQGIFPKDQFSDLGLDYSLFSLDGLEFYGKINLLKGAIVFSDAITTVSPTYAKEIQGKEFGFGLEGVLAQKRDVLYGIINGLDYSVWDPAKDKMIAKKYSAKSLKNKAANKKALRKVCNLPDKNVPILGIVSRLAQQKGLDILSDAMDQICNLELQLVILGTGDNRYHLVLERIRNKYPKVCSVHLKFDEKTAHQIYAGSDIFLMPSRYEPCGLGQMISFKYATLPLVFKTGGLADTVNPKNGFIFDQYNRSELIKTIKQALAAYSNKRNWTQLMKTAVSYNFSWSESAKKYLELYNKL